MENKDKIDLVKTEVEEVRKLIDQIPYEADKKLFNNNLINDKRLYKQFLPLTSILMVISFLSTSSWPIFLDKRIGRGGKKVNIFKIRTMYIDAETNASKYLNEAQMKEWKKERKVTNDPRITKFGRFLRKTSLDELPQLINVLIGNMSFVGPRPITESEIKDNFNELETKALLSSRPGLTGYWQVVGRSDDTWTSGERKNLTLLDIEHSSLLFDAKVLPTIKK